jgi:hypothetical protein
MVRKFIAGVMASGLALALSACVLVDKYSDRAVEYNRQAEQAQEQDLLLNVVRAMDRRPMQFTSLQTVTGQATASGSGSISFPFGHRPNASAQRIASFTDSFSGGPIFVVAVLDTQEFYQGLMKPIPGQYIDLYLEARYPPEEVLDLTIHQIEIKNCGNPDRLAPGIVFENYPSDDFKYNLFQTLLEHFLIEHGLKTEKVEARTAMGPPLTEYDLMTHADVIARAVSANLKVVKYTAPDPAPAGSSDEPSAAGCKPPAEKAGDKNPKGQTQSTDKAVQDNTAQDKAAQDKAAQEKAAQEKEAQDKAAHNKGDKYQIVKAENVYRFCFSKSPVDEADKSTPDNKDRGRCGAMNEKSASTPQGQEALGGISTNLKDIEHLLDQLAKAVDDTCAELKLSAKDHSSVATDKLYSDNCEHTPKLSKDLIEIYNPKQIKGECTAYVDYLFDAVKKPNQAKEEEKRVAAQDKKSISTPCYNYAVQLWHEVVTSQSVGNISFSIKFYDRSTESLLYYLGELARRQLHPDNGWPARTIVVQAADQPRDDVHCLSYIDVNSVNNDCIPLFRLNTGIEGEGFLSVNYDGTTYSIPSGNIAGLSYPALEIAKQLFALNLSAKDLPATTTLSVISSP